VPLKAAGAGRQAKPAPDESEPLKPEDLELYLEAAASVVEELRDFLSAHHAELIAAKHTPNKWGGSSEMPAAYQDPAYAGRVHNLRIACDHFINIMRGNLNRADAQLLYDWLVATDR
jgi:hypothetical protein